jgi:hypothetical protein
VPLTPEDVLAVLANAKLRRLVRTLETPQIDFKIHL